MSLINKLQGRDDPVRERAAGLLRSPEALAEFDRRNTPTAKQVHDKLTGGYPEGMAPWCSSGPGGFIPGSSEPDDYLKDEAQRDAKNVIDAQKEAELDKIKNSKNLHGEENIKHKHEVELAKAKNTHTIVVSGASAPAPKRAQKAPAPC